MDYKISTIKDETTGITKVTAKYYDGEETTEDEFNVETGEVEPVTRYRRSKLLETVEYEVEEV